MDTSCPHRRLNLLTGEWVLVSPHRARRPWLGQVEKGVETGLPAYDPACYLCPGNQRSSGITNAGYTSTFVFDNDFPALLPVGQATEAPGEGLFVAEPEVGICRVVCFSPRHDLTLPELPLEGVIAVVCTWAEQTAEIGRRDEISYVQVFENKGEMMGCSNPHPHSQIWASGHIPNQPAVELIQMRAYQQNKGTCLLCDVLHAELECSVRIVAQNEHFTALVPFWAVWPFEILLIANRHCGSLVDLVPAEVGGLAALMKEITTRYDNLFEMSFPYSMGFHQTPTDGRAYPAHHLHAHYYPPLLRSATVRKFMVGFEMLGMPQRDLTPETAAQRLREVSPVHYRLGKT